MNTEFDHTEEGSFNEEEFLLARLQRELEGYRSRLQEIEHFHPLDRIGSAHATIVRFSPYYGKKSEAYRGSDSRPEASLWQANTKRICSIFWQ